ncbi:hypothetical protein KIN20_032387 [Parelaphostrongylus tenuis]|uniref:Uncharacterized protein n=1 Tax=Parelaphostrongylus tenuis TaxID=148309 RepID=A0AAD5R8Q8_PARTN|nr:hypothetical protein KIN20_032387 [Parelaphostrongylus tenuis]
MDVYDTPSISGNLCGVRPKQNFILPPGESFDGWLLTDIPLWMMRVIVTLSWSRRLDGYEEYCVLQYKSNTSL